MKYVLLIIYFASIVITTSALASDSNTLTSDGFLDRLHLTLTAGKRQDNLDWSINAGPMLNVLSELEWRNMKSNIIKLYAELALKPNLDLIGSIGVGSITGGTTQDSDYCRPNRQGEFSRSLVQGEGNLYDIDIGLRFKYSNYIDGSVGIARNEQRFDMNNGTQVVSDNISVHDSNICLFTLDPTDGVPPEGFILTNLRSSYDTKWSGPWLGLSGQILREKLILTGGARIYPGLDYEGVGRWGSRGTSGIRFIQTASAFGYQGNLFAGYLLNIRSIIGINLSYYHFDTGTGNEKLINPDGCDPGATTTVCNFIGIFNGATWDAWSIALLFRFNAS